MTSVDSKTIHSEVLSHLRQGADDIESLVRGSVDRNYPLLDDEDSRDVIESVLNDIVGYGFLERYLRDDSINEIMINSPTDGYIERNGVFEAIELHTTDEELVRLAQKIASEIGGRFDPATPILDAWLSDGSRVNAVMPPIAAKGMCITIRKFPNRQREIIDFCGDKHVADYVTSLIESRHNIIIAGGTSTGKTSFLGACMNEVESCQRIITIEETSELISSHRHWIRLISRSANTEGTGQISLSDLVKTSLRMRPDRLIVGEVRSHEAFDLIQALNTGHDGSMGTIHANGPEEVLYRLTSLALFAHQGLDHHSLLTQASFGVDDVIFIRRLGDSRRVIDSIHSVDNTGHTFTLSPLYERKEAL